MINFKVWIVIHAVFALPSAIVLAEGRYEASDANGKPNVILEYYEDISGTLQIILPNDNSIDSSQISVGLDVPIGATLRTGEGDSAELRLHPSGSIIKIAENTSFKVEIAHMTAESRLNAFNIPFGKIRAIIAKTAPFDEYKFISNTAVCSIRGTDFIMEVTPGKTEAVFVIEGSAKFENAAGKSIDITEGKIVDALDLDFQARGITPAEKRRILGGLQFKKLQPSSVSGAKRTFKNAVSLDLLGGIYALRAYVGYERRLIDGFAGKLAIDYRAQTLDGLAFNQVGFFPDFRYYMNDLAGLLFSYEAEPLEGPFIGIGAKLYYSQGDNDATVSRTLCSYSVAGFFVAPSVEVGYKFMVDSKSLTPFEAFVEPVLGYSYSFGRYEATRSCGAEDQTYIIELLKPGGLIYGLQIGIAF